MMVDLQRYRARAKVLAHRLRLLNDLRRNDGRLSVPYQTVMIETTSFCNLDCPICPARHSENVMDRAAQQIAPGDFRRIVDLTHNLTESFCLNMWGEPALHKNFLELVDYASSPGRKVWFSTNLNYSERIASALAANPHLHIICSTDGWDEASYLQYRWRGRFEVMRKNLAILARGNCTIYPQFLVDSDDAEARERFRNFVLEVTGTTENIIFKTKLDNIRNDPLRVETGRCSSMYAGLYFTSDGFLIPCCTNVKKDLYLRHVSSYSTGELTNGDDIKNLRHAILANKNQFDSCKSCRGEDQQALIVQSLVRRIKQPFGMMPVADPAKRL